MHYLLFLFSILNIHSEINPSTQPFFALYQDTLGVPMSSKKFDSLVVFTLNKFGHAPWPDGSDSDYITFIRLDNTIAYGRLQSKKEIYTRLEDLYIEKYLKRIVAVSQATLTRGMGYYSKKYDIQIGGSPTKDNFYRLCD